MASKVAVYCRVSTQEQSTDLQREEIQRYVTAREWAVTAFYEDKATGTNANRPELKKLLNDARQRKFEIVICWKLDRLFRSLKDLVVTLQEFNDLGIEFISLKDNIDLTTASGRLLMQIIGAMAEFEVCLVKERVKAGLKAAKSKGRVLGRPRRIDLTKVAQLRRDGLSLNQIAQRLGTTKGGVSKTLKKLGLGLTHNTGG